MALLDPKHHIVSNKYLLNASRMNKRMNGWLCLPFTPSAEGATVSLHARPCRLLEWKYPREGSDLNEKYSYFNTKKNSALSKRVMKLLAC